MSGFTNIFKEGCLVSLSISKWGGPRKIPKDVLEEKGLDVDSEWVSGYKKLVSQEALKPINGILNSATAIINKYSLPFPIRAVNFIPKGLIEKLDLQLQDINENLKNAVEEFADHYEEHKDRAREELGEELFDESQYPHNIRDQFSIRWNFFLMDVPSNELGILSPSQYQAEMEKMRNTIVEAQEMAIEALRTQLAKILKDAVSKLKDKEAKRFHSSLIGKFQDFFSTFSDRNVFGDRKLEEIVELCKEALDGVEIDEIRSDEQYRKEVATDLVDVQEILEKAMIKKPKRNIIIARRDGERPKRRRSRPFKRSKKAVLVRVRK